MTWKRCEAASAVHRSGEAGSAEAAQLDGVDIGGEQVVQELGVAGLVAFGGFEGVREAVGDGGQA
jgi:hypothetical protein